MSFRLYKKNISNNKEGTENPPWHEKKIILIIYSSSFFILSRQR